MSPDSRPSRLGGNAGYQRPSLDVLDDLTNPGTRGTSGYSGPRGASAVSDTSVSLGTSVTQGASDTKKPSEPRDHVKVGRSLVDEMRDAVWFLSEHGRPRVQLGELFDEAVRAWLEAAKAEHNEGDPFPVRGRLR